MTSRFGRLLEMTFRPNGPTARVARARRFMDSGEYNEARLETEGLLDAEAVNLHLEAMKALVALNLDEYRARRAAGERSEAEDALRRAKRFGATPEQIEEAKRRRGPPDRLPTRYHTQKGPAGG